MTDRDDAEIRAMWVEQGRAEERRLHEIDPENVNYELGVADERRRILDAVKKLQGTEVVLRGVVLGIIEGTSDE